MAPIVALINANSAFMQYSSGIFKCNYTTTESELNHAVVIIGYDSSGNYLIKNSWGKGWGTNGFGWVSGATTENCGLSLYTYQISSKTFVNSNNPTNNVDNSSSSNTSTPTTKWISALRLSGALFVTLVLTW